MVADANDADEEEMNLFNDDSSDEYSEGSVTEELLIILRKGFCHPNYKQCRALPIRIESYEAHDLM